MGICHSNICSVSECKKKVKLDDSEFCESHRCSEKNCINEKSSSHIYCTTHKCGEYFCPNKVYACGLCGSCLSKNISKC